MRDFSKNHLTRTPITKGKLTSAPKQESQKNWQQTIAPIQQPKAASRNWLKQDWFWNIIIWSCISSSIPFISLARKFISISYLPLSILLALWIVAILIIILRRPTYVGENIFLNAHGVRLTNWHLPHAPFVPFFLFFFFLIFTIIGYKMIYFRENNYSLFVNIIFYHTAFFGFFIYFIFKSCPIAIFFKKEFWQYLKKIYASLPTEKVSPSSSRSYKFLRSNIFNEDRWK